jgi:hypothetical protein
MVCLFTPKGKRTAAMFSDDVGGQARDDARREPAGSETAA